MAENRLRRGRFSTVDLLNKVACFVEKVKNISLLKVADLNWFVQGQPYEPSPFVSVP